MGAVAKPPTAAPSARRVGFWIGLLALAQVADLLTTQIDMQRGGMEANAVAAALIQTGGIGLLWFVKLALVGAMAGAAVLARSYWLRSADGRARMAQAVIWRCTQCCVLLLVLTAANNVQVLSQLTISNR